MTQAGETNRDIVQAMRVGATDAVCRMGKTKSTVDTRPYGAALKAAGWSLISEWIRGKWSEASKQECFEFLRYALNHGSIHMVHVASLALGPFPLIRKELTDNLTSQEKQKLKALLNMASVVGAERVMLPWLVQLD